MEVLPIFFSLQNSTLQCLAEITRSRVIGGPVYGPVASLLPERDSQDSLEVCTCIHVLPRYGMLKIFQSHIGFRDCTSGWRKK